MLYHGNYVLLYLLSRHIFLNGATDLFFKVYDSDYYSPSSLAFTCVSTETLSSFDLNILTIALILFCAVNY